MRVNSINERINLGHFNRATAQVGPNEYSLAERYQISENIRTCKGYKTVLLSILGFNLICIGAVVIDNFRVTIFVKNIANTALNYATLMYGFTVQLVNFYYSNLWQSELKRMISKVCPKRQINDRTVGIKSTFGKKMLVDGTEYSKRYFEMLRKNWS
ncbi:hypothetical protein OSTOST_02010 [Ostertagia ostertagi]